MPAHSWASAALALVVLGSGFAEARIPRSAKAVAEFKREHPCPANGARRGPCPGWQVDHIKPLKCHGADATFNMQWLTVEAHKAKSKREIMLCRAPRKAPGESVSAD